MNNLKTYCFRRIAMVLVLAMVFAMLPIAAPVSATENNPILTLDTQLTVTITAGAQTYVAFTPEVTCTYEFYSVAGTSTAASSDTYGFLYDSDFNLLRSNDDGKGNSQFQIIYQLEAGQTYYLGCRYYNSSTSGSFDVMVTAKHSFTEEIIEVASCDEPGTKRFVCTCGYSYTESYTVDHAFDAGHCVYCGCVGGFCGSDVTWIIDDTVLTISGTGNIRDYGTDGADWAEYSAELETVVVGEGVTRIGDNALNSFTELTEVQLPSTVYSIGYCSFWNCTKLTSLELPEQLREIERLGLANTGLIELELPKSLDDLGEEALKDCLDLELIRFRGDAPYFGSNVFSGDTLTARYPMRNATWTEDVFQNYGGEVTWAAGMSDTVIDNGKCGNNVYWSLDIDGTMTISGTGDMDCFPFYSDVPWYNYASLVQSVTIENGVTNVGDYAFYGCNALTQVQLPEGCTSIGHSAFNGCAALTSITLPESCTSIGSSTFSYCVSLTAIDIPDNCTSIGSHVFVSCTSLAEVQLPEGCTSIESYTFYDCASLTAVTIPESCTSINYNAFTDCIALAEVNIPNSCTRIDHYAFWGCNSLTEVEIPNACSVIAESAFSNCSSLTRFTVAEENPVYEDDDGVLIDKENGYLMKYPAKRPGTTYVVPDGIELIVSSAFSDATELTSVTLPETVLYISDYAFNGCTNLRDINLPAGLTFLSEGLFMNCSSLTSLELPQNLSSIHNLVFSGCTSLKELDIPNSVTWIKDLAFLNCASLEKLELPEKLTTLPWYTIAGCNALTELTIPASVFNITDTAYDEPFNCADLKAVTFNGNAPSISSNTFEDANLVGYYPAGNSTWTEDVRQSYGGNVTWLPYGDADLVATGTCNDTVVWTLRADNVLTISGTGTVENRWSGYGSDILSAVVEDGITAIASNTFDFCRQMRTITFVGNAPVFGEAAFAGRELIAYYPSVNATWTEDVRQSYGGNVVWLPLDENAPVGSGQCGDNLTWTLSKGGVLDISGEGTMWDFEETSPQWSDFDFFVNRVQIDDGVTTIGDYALQDCTNMTEVQLPDSVFEIGYASFWNCSKLTALELPAALTKLDARALMDCSDLEYVRFQGDAPEIGMDVFSGDALIACYPMTNLTWTEDVRQNYGGNVNWLGEVDMEDLVGLEVISAPTGGVVGGEPDLSGLVVELIYINDVRIIANNDELTFTGLDTSSAGKKTVTVSYGDFSAEFIYLVHEGAPNVVLDPSVYPESEHDYLSNLNDIQTLTWPGASSLVLVFSQNTRVEPSYDWLYVYDGADNEIARYTGGSAAGITLEVPGDTVKIKLSSDGSVSDYGYAFSSITATGMIIHTSNGEVIPAVEATCTEPGRTEGYVCAVCDEIQYTVIPALGHDYESVVTPPTPEENGYTTHTCTRCGDSYVDNITTYEVIAQGTCGDNLTWVLTTDGSLVISGQGPMTDFGYWEAPWINVKDSITNLVIQEGVTTIGDNAFLYCDNLTSAAIPESVTSIGERAFFVCCSLRDVTIPEAVDSIEAYAFNNCTSLSSVTIPARVESIGNWAFAGCESLTDFHVSEENAAYSNDDFGVLFNKDQTELVQAPGMLSGSYVIPDSVTKIGSAAFMFCHHLTDITIPASVLEMGANAFSECSNLTEIHFLGSAPEGNHRDVTDEACCFYGVTATAQYPLGDPSWTDEVMYNYGGNIEWNGIGPNGELGMGTCGDNLTWVVDRNGVLHISGTGAMYDYSYIHSEEPDAVFSPWKPLFEQITQILMDEGITAIGDFAFQGIYNAPNTVIPSTVEVIGGRAFNGHVFNELVIPEGVRIIEDYAFVSGTIGKLYFPSTLEAVQKGVFEWATIDEIHIPSMEAWMQIQFDSFFATPFSADGTAVFYVDGVMTTDIVIPESVTEIHDNQFDCFGELSSIQFHDGVTRIGDGAFRMSPNYGNSAPLLTEITIPASVTYIGDEAFYRCSHLNDVYILSRDCEFGADVFYDCNWYFDENDNFISNPVNIHGYPGSTAEAYAAANGHNFIPLIVETVATGWSGATQWTLTDDGVLTVYGEGNMKNYGYNGGQPWLNKGVEVTSVVIEEGVTGVGSGAFMNLTTLESVTFPESSLTKIGEAAFYGSGLESVEIPASLWTIQPYTFKNCADLTEVIFNEGNLQKISDGAFYGTGLTELVLPDCLDILDVYAFKGCADLTSITIGSGLTELREAVFYGTAIPAITVPEGVTKIGPYAFKNCVALETIDLPESLTSVGEASFYACTGLKETTLPDAVTAIGNYAFRKCAAMETLIFGSELVTIGECAFYGCTGLTELVIPDSVTTIKPYAFKTCTGLTSVTLGSSVATIGEGAFNTCTGLKTIVFPASVEAIGNYAFSGSYNLWKLTFEGNAPTIGTGAFKGLNATAYYPTGNSTWTDSVRQNYGGSITWKAQ